MTIHNHKTRTCLHSCKFAIETWSPHDICRSHKAHEHKQVQFCNSSMIKKRYSPSVLSKLGHIVAWSQLSSFHVLNLIFRNQVHSMYVTLILTLHTPRIDMQSRFSNPSSYLKHLTMYKTMRSNQLIKPSTFFVKIPRSFSSLRSPQALNFASTTRISCHCHWFCAATWEIFGVHIYYCDIFGDLESTSKQQKNTGNNTRSL